MTIIVARTACAGLLVTVLLLLVSPRSFSADLDHADLLQLFDDWREFDSPPLLAGAPDYTVESIAASPVTASAMSQQST